MKPDKLPFSVSFGLYIGVIGRLALVAVLAGTATIFLWIGNNLILMAKRLTGDNYYDGLKPESDIISKIV